MRYYQEVSMKWVISVTTLISLIFIQPVTGNTSLDDRLRTAVSNQDFTTIEALVKKGADPNVSDESSMTPLALAAGDGKIELIKLLLYKGADINYTIVGKHTPLMRAAQNNSFTAVKLLCERGADLMNGTS
jgi:ankyrin repeat protein